MSPPPKVNANGVPKVYGSLSTEQPQLAIIDREPIGVDVRPARHQERRTSDMNLIAEAVHRPITRCDAKRVLSGVVLTAEECELLPGLQVTVGTVFGKMSDLCPRGRRNTSKRQSADYELH